MRTRVPPELKKPAYVLAVIVGLLSAFLVGYAARGPAPGQGPGESVPQSPAQVQVWTCSMHPEIRLPKPGLCPKCRMDLIPVSTGGGGPAGLREFTTSDAAKQLMNIEVAEVERRFVTKEVRLVGKVDFDETRMAYITAWVPGRLDRLYVDYTGIQVNKGDHMVYLYSPDLLVAQDELRRAAKAIGEIRSSAPAVLKDTAEATRQAARERLRRWGLTGQQIDEAEKRGISSDHVTIYSPISGTVIHRDGQEGMYVDEGTRIYTIADMSQVWVKLDAYESDLPWLHYGQKTVFTTEAYPGDEFEGRISFIDPVLDKMTRTVKVRVVVANPGGKLKPEMFVRAVVRAEVATGGRVMDPDLAGKWISPMHPEVVKDEPGPCDVCGMPLVKAEDLGYVAARPTPEDMPLVRPASAPLVTGTRAVAYVEVPGMEQPTYEGREIALGPRAGAFYLVRSGLREGDRVVTRGAFKIDSALQIQAKPSMMSPPIIEGSGHDHADEDVAMRYDAPPGFREQLLDLYTTYLDVTAALASDNFEDAHDAVNSAGTALDSVDTALLEGDAHTVWMGIREDLDASLDSMEKATEIEAVRKELPGLTDALSNAIVDLGLPPGETAYRVHCPMVFDGEGADWLQADTAVQNPYYGSMMLECGEVAGRLDAGGDPHGEHAAPHAPEPAPAESEGSHHEGSSHE